MIRFLLGFGIGVAAMLGVLIAEEYLRDEALRNEGSEGPISFDGPLTWTA